MRNVSRSPYECYAIISLSCATKLLIGRTLYGAIVGLCKSILLILKVKTGGSEGISEQRKVIKLLIIIQRLLLLRLQRRKLYITLPANY